jgi:soluble lytic murein transglycosylase-like protein
MKDYKTKSAIVGLSFAVILLVLGIAFSSGTNGGAVSTNAGFITELATQVRDVKHELSMVRKELDYTNKALTWGTTPRIAKAIDRHADNIDIPRKIAWKLVEIESGFDSTAVSGAGAVGLTQLLLPTAQEVLENNPRFWMDSIYGYNQGWQHPVPPSLTRDTLFNVDLNLKLGFTYLKKMHEKFSSWEHALSAYNGGPTRVGRGWRNRFYEKYILGE